MIATTSLLYSLPKIHKLLITVRPVVCFISSPTSKLAKFLYALLGDINNLSNRILLVFSPKRFEVLL